MKKQLLQLFVVVLLIAAQTGCGTSRGDMIEVALRGDGSEYQKNGVHVILKGDDVLLNGTEQIKTLGSVITFRYPDGRPDEIEFLLHEE